MRCDIPATYQQYGGISISIHAPRMRCDHPALLFSHTLQRISIHAPRMRCDCITLSVPRPTAISIHAPRMRCDTGSLFPMMPIPYFNPRTSHEVRPRTPHYLSDCCNFNPRTSHEVRRTNKRKLHNVMSISIHAPRMRCDIAR